MYCNPESERTRIELCLLSSRRNCEVILYATENQVADLQRQIDGLAKRVLDLAERLNKLEASTREEALARMAQGLELKFTGVTVEALERCMQRWDEVYYHVFPDRFKGDQKFEHQLHHLICPPKHGDDKKKS
jgi:hypothetical protein